MNDFSFSQFQQEWDNSRTDLSGRRIRVMDTTLREFAQGPGMGLTEKNKLLLAVALADTGVVDVLEIGHASSPEDTPQKLAPIIAELNYDGAPILRMLSRGLERDVDWSGEVLKDVDPRRKEIHIYIPTDPNINHRIKADNPEDRKQKTLVAIRANIEYARKQGFQSIQFSPEGGLTTPDFDFLCKSCMVAIDAGATVLNIPDTLGKLDPIEVKKRFELLKQVLEPYMQQYGVIFSAHMHNDDGMAPANTLAAILPATGSMTKDGFHFQIETSLNGGGERNGIGPLATLVTRIQEASGVSDAKVGELLYLTSHAVRLLTGYKASTLTPTVGDVMFLNSAGVHHAGQKQAEANGGQGGYLNRSRMERFGIKPDVTVFYQSGTTMIADILEKNGIHIERDKPEGREMLENFKQYIDKSLLDAQGWKEWNIVRAWYEWNTVFRWEESNLSEQIIFSLQGRSYTVETLDDGSHLMSYIGGLIQGINKFFETNELPWRMSEDMDYSVQNKETSTNAAKRLAPFSPRVKSVLERGKLDGDIEGLGYCEVGIRLTNTNSGEQILIKSRGSGTNMQEVTMRAMIEGAVLPVLHQIPK